MLREWLRTQWTDVKGNVKFWVLCTLVAGVTAGGSWAVTYVEKLIHGLPEHSRTVLLGLYVVNFAALLLALAWGVATTRTARVVPPRPMTLPSLPTLAL